MAIIASFTPSVLGGVSQIIFDVDIDSSNYASIGITPANRARNVVVTGGVTQADISLGAGSLVVGTRSTVGSNIETNNILQSIDGATGGTADTLATLFVPTRIRLGERATDGAIPFFGTIHHAVIVSGAKTQAELNALTAAVAALPARS